MTKDGRITSGMAAAILGVSQRTFNRYHDDGLVKAIDRVPGTKGARLYDETAIHALATKRLEERKADLAKREEQLDRMSEVA
jgi:DNA-binding transcriptional MerR regulator